MIIIKKQSFLLVLFLVCFVSSIEAQSTYSPYSTLGLGEIDSRDYGRTSGMGNIGIGVRDFDYLNPANPAGISGLDSLKFIFDVSVAGKQSYYSGKGKGDDAFNGNLKKLSLGLRIAPKWGISIGAKPFSDVGYQIYSEEPVEGSSATKNVYLEGSGGLYQVYISNGYKITDNWSVGMNTMYITGTLKHTENQSEYLFRKESETTQFYNTFGVQYHKKAWTLGATYGYKQKLTMKNKTAIYDSEYNLQKEEKDRTTSQFIPETMGLGFSYNNRKYIWGMDFKYQKWNGLSSGVSSAKIVDSYSINAGVGYTPNGDAYHRMRKLGQMQLGASLSKSYIQVGGKDAYNYSVSAGYSFPFDKGGCLFNVALEYGNSLSAPASYIKESYFMVTLNCTIMEQWFKKIRID